MKLEQLVEVDVGDAVAPGEHKSRIAEVRLQTLDAAAGVGRYAGVDQVDSRPPRPVVAIVVGLDTPVLISEIRQSGIASSSRPNSV